MVGVVVGVATAAVNNGDKLPIDTSLTPAPGLNPELASMIMLSAIFRFISQIVSVATGAGPPDKTAHACAVLYVAERWLSLTVISGTIDYAGKLDIS